MPIRHTTNFLSSFNTGANLKAKGGQPGVLLEGQGLVQGHMVHHQDTTRDTKKSHWHSFKGMAGSAQRSRAQNCSRPATHWAPPPTEAQIFQNWKLLRNADSVLPRNASKLKEDPGALFFSQTVPTSEIILLSQSRLTP